MMRQCRLVSGNGGHFDTWLDDKRISVGSVVSLKGESGQHIGPFTIISMSEMTMDNNTVNERSRDWTKTRQASDI